MVKSQTQGRVMLWLGVATAFVVVVNALIGGVGIEIAAEPGTRVTTGLDGPLFARLAALPAAICLSVALICASGRHWQAAGLWLMGYGVNAALKGIWLGLLKVGQSGEYDFVVSITGAHLVAIASGVGLAVLARGLRARERELAEFI